MASKSSKRYSKKRAFERSFEVGMSFLESAWETGATPERSAPLLDDLFHGMERLAVALLSMEVGGRFGKHGDVFNKFSERFNDEFGNDLIEFYQEVREKANSLLYDFGPDLKRKQLETPTGSPKEPRPMPNSRGG